MINIKSLTKKDIGRWVRYWPPTQISWDDGRIKSWNDKFIFVVYKCDKNWPHFQNYTAESTNPVDLNFLEKYWR